MSHPDDATTEEVGLYESILRAQEEEPEEETLADMLDAVLGPRP